MGSPPRVYRTLQRDAKRIRKGPTGDVGSIFRGSGFEVVWVSKKGESIDRRWFRLSSVDLLLVVRGRLRVDFQERRLRPKVLKSGDLLVLPPRVKCRAYRWPRSSKQATVFVAMYPISRGSKAARRKGSHRGA